MGRHGVGGNNGADGLAASGYRLHLNPLKTSASDLDQQLLEVGNKNKDNDQMLNTNTLVFLAVISLFIILCYFWGRQ